MHTPKKEPSVVSATVRDTGDDWHIECRFSDGQKFAAVRVDYDCPELANRIAKVLTSEDPKRVARMVIAERLKGG
jgi:hypothetical protein